MPFDLRRHQSTGRFQYMPTSLFPCAARRQAFLLLALVCGGASAAAPERGWGTPERPFAATSPWNARPDRPVFGTYVIPESRFFPGIGAGPFSTGVFVARPGDPAVEISGPGGKGGVAEPDTESARVVTIPHWPADVAAATGSDGHADIVDPESGVIHSFWQLKQKDGRWSATLYSWSPLAGRGWGDPSHYYQGARATAVPTSAGLIRKHEIDDGAPVYRHALAMSLTYNALARDPAYIFPATAADNNAATTNSGQIPQGALLMLPPSFDSARIANPALRKVAETLKLYGAYVVDRNDGTPFFIYVEAGGKLPMGTKAWDPEIAAELQRIRAGLRQVVSAAGWIDGDGKPFTPATRLSFLSMEGNWRGPDQGGHYDPKTDALAFPANAQGARLSKLGLLNMRRIHWAAPKAGDSCELSVQAGGGALLRLVVRSRDYSVVLFDSGELGNGASKRFVCPTGTVRTEMQVSGAAAPSWARAELHPVPDTSR
jgi:hypothetical protein